MGDNMRLANAELTFNQIMELPHRGAVDVPMPGRVRSTIPQRLARGTVVDVLFRRIPKLLPRGPSPSLMAAIDDRDVRGDAPRQEPCQELAAAVGFVGPQTFRVQSQRLELLEHPAGRQGFL